MLFLLCLTMIKNKQKRIVAFIENLVMVRMILVQFKSIFSPSLNPNDPVSPTLNPKDSISPTLNPKDPISPTLNPNPKINSSKYFHLH